MSGLLGRTVATLRLTQFLQMRRSITTATKATKVGVVGCGNVGTAVTHNLVQQGFPVVAAYDLNPARLAALPKGITTATCPREVAQLADVVITGLPRPPAVKAAVEGPDGILAGLSKGKVWIDHSTTDSDKTKEYSVEAQAKGAHVLEAPITGGLDALKKRQMVVFIGGDKNVADAVQPVLDASYNKVFYVGEIGQAMMVKLSSNMLAMINCIAMGEVLMLVKRADMDLKTFWEAIRVSAGHSYIWETAAPLVFNGSYDPSFPMALMNKDLQLGYDLARKHGVPMDIHLAALAISRRTQFQLGDDAGCYSPPKIYELALRESLNIPNFDNWTYDNEIYKGSIVVEHKGIE